MQKGDEVVVVEIKLVWIQIFSHEITTEKRQGNSLCGHPTDNPVVAGTSYFYFSRSNLLLDWKVSQV